MKGLASEQVRPQLVCRRQIPPHCQPHQHQRPQSSNHRQHEHHHDVVSDRRQRIGEDLPFSLPPFFVSRMQIPDPCAARCQSAAAAFTSRLPSNSVPIFRIRTFIRNTCCPRRPAVERVEGALTAVGSHLRSISALAPSPSFSSPKGDKIWTTTRIAGTRYATVTQNHISAPAET